jgi:peptide-methionine (S)-S-oxide reductase
MVGAARPSSEPAPSRAPGAHEVATLGGGCFWCTDAVFRDLKGVDRVVSGYAGGTTSRPSYEDVCTGTTGHAEVNQVTFDPTVLSYADLLRIFFSVHDPTTLNRQGADTGTQYRSVILYHSPEQRATAEAVRAEIEAARLHRGRVVTEIAPFREFFPAEEYHQDYFRRNPGQGYCRVVVAPKVAKFRQTWTDRLKR